MALEGLGMHRAKEGDPGFEGPFLMIPLIKAWSAVLAKFLLLDKIVCGRH